MILEVNIFKIYRFLIKDVVVYDVGDIGEEFGFEIGFVCFL